MDDLIMLIKRDSKSNMSEVIRQKQAENDFNSKPHLCHKFAKENLSRNQNINQYHSNSMKEVAKMYLHHGGAATERKK